MRNILLVIGIAMLTGASAAEPPGPSKSDRSPSKLLPVKSGANVNSCAAYGAGFVKVEGTDTCVKVGGAISVGAGVSAGGTR